MNVVYEKHTKKPLAEAILAVKEALLTKGYGVLWELNLGDKIREKGLDFDKDFQVMEVCNPKKARDVLEAHLDMGYFLPCKVGVYQQDGQTRIGMLRPESLMSLAGHSELDGLAKEVEMEIREALDSVE